MERQLENIVRFHDIDNVKLYLKKNPFQIKEESISNFSINPMLIAFNQEKYDILNLIYHSPLFKERIKHLTESQVEDFQKVMISNKLNQF